MPITIRFTNFGLSQHILPDASASGAPTLVVHTNKWQCFLDLVLPKDTRPFSLPISSDSRIKYPSRRTTLLLTKSQRSRWILIHCTTFMLLRSSYSSLLYRMRKSLSTRTESEVLRRTFLSNFCRSSHEMPVSQEHHLAYIHNWPLQPINQHYWPSFSHHLCCACQFYA